MVAKKTAVSGDPAPAEKATAARKTAAKKAPAKKASAKKASAKKSAAAEKAPAEKATAAGKKTTAVRKTTAVEKRTATAKKVAAEGAAHAAKKTGVRNVVAKKSTGAARKTAAAATSGLPKTRVMAAAAAPGELAVRPGEDPWTPQEVEEARAELVSEVLRLRAELDASEVAISGLMRDSGDGAGDDQADTGTKNITRESELALAANASSMLEQTERALERLEAGTYGLCENCGQPIGKARMQAFPRATLCVDCKQKQERRH
ncbi:TraR/DksA family transcriptional regulator [Streptomyces erythrochromogenes]|uniref:TraR/DksA family transcriptional regulator n=1 Tax=Streptomyces erythrochromogenes TaxID=285574 RepID=UPI003807464C